MTGAVKRGRPRSEAIDDAIIDATVAELIERGYVGLSMEGIAARAGVAKTTLYRRWPNTEDLAIEAMRTFEQTSVAPPPGTVREQLSWLLDGMRRKWSDPRYGAIMRRVTSDGVSAPHLYRQARDRLVSPHLHTMHSVLQRAVDEGVIRAGVELGWIRQLLTAPILAATLTYKDRVSKAQVEATIDIVLRGLAP